MGETHILKHLHPQRALGRLHHIMPVPPAHELLIGILHPCCDHILDCLLDLLLHQPGREQLERLIQEVVLGVAD